MLLDMVSAVRQRLLCSAQAAGDGAGTVPAPSSVGTHVLSHKAGFQQHCSSSQVLSEVTHTSAFGCTCKFSQMSQCLTDSLDSLP